MRAALVQVAGEREEELAQKEDPERVAGSRRDEPGEGVDPAQLRDELVDRDEGSPWNGIIRLAMITISSTRLPRKLRRARAYAASESKDQGEEG